LSARVLILGAAGMLGHKLWQAYRDRFDIWGTVRSSHREYAGLGLFDPERLLGGVDAFDFDSVVRALAMVKPDVVVNTIGIIKQLPNAQDPIISLTVNSLFPHRLANLCRASSARLVHISTDCVFSGRRGMYVEKDESDAEDLYGRTKYLGEVSGSSGVTVRTSIIGRELQTTSGLVEWFLSNRGGRVRGYTRAIYSGFTTLALANIIAEVIERHPDLTGVYQVSSEPIAKYDLLCLLRDEYAVDVDIQPSADVQVDRSLDSSRFRAVTGFLPLSWPEMIRAMASDPTPYEDWRLKRVP
jgi:dTDP-4-dehydrorhamnose reductase